MAVFDQDAQKIVVRVVYDGPGMAGKTTNLQQLCKFFTPFRRTDLYSPEASSGRTTFLDWLQIDSGLVGGKPLRSHFITVPGQRVLARRRFSILELADVVVFVCDSTQNGVAESANMFEMLRLFLDTKGITPPIVVQANKQDVPGALSLTEISERLGIGSDIVVVAAQAASGTGVRETAVLAIRAAADRVQTALREHGQEALYGVAENGVELRERIVRAEAETPMSPVQVVLGHHQGMWKSSPPQPDPAPESVSENSEPEVLPATRGATSESKALAAMVGIEETVRDSDWERVTVPDEPKSALGSASKTTAADAKTETLRTVAQVPEKVLERTPTHETEQPPAKPRATPRTVDELRPPLPTPDVASGFVWPSATGRDLLRRVPLDKCDLRSDLRGSFGVADGSGRSDSYIYEAGIWCLKTSLRRRYVDQDEARSSLLQLVRRKLQLGEMLCHNTVVSLERDSDGGFWLWTTTPWLSTLRANMEHAARADDEERLADALVRYAEIAVRSAAATARQGLVLDVHPSNFAAFGEKTYYLDDDILIGTQAPAIGYALLQRVEEYAPFPKAVGAYVDAVARLVGEHLSAEEVEDLELGQLIEDTLVRTSAAQAAKRQLADIVTTLSRSTA